MPIPVKVWNLMNITCPAGGAGGRGLTKDEWGHKTIIDFFDG